MIGDMTRKEQLEHQADDRAETRSVFIRVGLLALALVLLWVLLVVPDKAGAQEITETTYGGSTRQTTCVHYANSDTSPHVRYRNAQGYWLEWDLQMFCDARSNWRITSIRTIHRVEARRPYENTWHDWVGPQSYTISGQCADCWDPGAGGNWRVAQYPRAPMIARGKAKFIVHGFSTLYPGVTFTDTYFVYLTNGQGWNIGWHQ